MARDFTPLSHKEILGGLSGKHTKRATTLLFAIESRTAHLVAHSQQALELFLPEEMVEQHNLTFLEALNRGRELPFKPTIQDIERYAPQWASLIPKNPALQAIFAHLLSQKYTFTSRTIPRTRIALGLDEGAVRDAYQRQYQKTLDTIFAPHIRLSERFRWRRAGLTRRLEELPPFWITFALTLTSIVGVGILALPIALAKIGPLAGIILLVIMGGANVLTIAFMAEAAVRTGTIRYGKSFLGRMVADYLGHRIASVFSIGLFIYCGLGIMAYYLGFALTLEDVTHIPAGIWVGCIFLAGLYFVQRKSLNATIASALLIGTINVCLILIFSLLTFRHSQTTNFFSAPVPFLNGQAFDASILQLVFGVIMTAYLGHLSVSNCAQIVLRRDPGGRALIWGTMAAQIAALALYCIWVLAVNGAIAPQILASESGTSLIPLAAAIGPMIKVLGTLFVLLALGMASIHPSLALFNLMHEWLPGKPKTTVSLARRWGQLIFLSRRGGIIGPESGPRLGLVYLGLNREQPLFRWDIQVGGRMYHREFCITKYWNSADLFKRLPELRQYDLQLALEITECSSKRVRLVIHSPLRMLYNGGWDTQGLSMAEIFTLPDDQRHIVNWLIRQNGTESAISFTKIVAFTGQNRTTACATLNALVSQNILQESKKAGERHYQIRFAHKKRGRPDSTDLNRLLDKKLGPVSLDRAGPPAGMRAFIHRITTVLLSDRGRAIISVSPLVVIFLLTEWLLIAGIGSFTALLNIRGILITPLLSGILPILLVMAGRQKGEFIPTVVSRVLHQSLIMKILYTLFLSSLFVHGFMIWEEPAKRIAALSVGILVIAMTIAIKRQGGFIPRLVVEIRHNQQKNRQAICNIVAGGKSVSANIELEYNNDEQQIQAASGIIPNFSTLRCAHVHLPSIPAQELKVWIHTITPEGDSESLPVLLIVHCRNGKKEYDLKLSRGQVVLPMPVNLERLELRILDDVS